MTDNCHLVFDFSMRNLLRGMLLRMRLAVTVLTGKSAILFSVLLGPIVIKEFSLMKGLGKA